MLSQEQDEKEMVYGSRTTIKEERRFCATHRELLSVVHPSHAALGRQLDADRMVLLSRQEFAYRLEKNGRAGESLWAGLELGVKKNRSHCKARQEGG